MMEFSTPDAAKLTDVTLRQIRYWDHRGLLKPSGKATGHRRYTFTDLVALKMVKGLRDQGLSLQKLRRAVAHLRANYPATTDSRALAGLTLLTDGQKVYLLKADALQEVMSKQTVMLIVPIGQMIVKTQQQTEKLPSERVEKVMVRGRAYHLDVTHDPDTGTYTVQCRELPGAIEQGDTPVEAVNNGKVAIESVLDFEKRRKALRGRGIARA